MKKSFIYIKITALILLGTLCIQSCKKEKRRNNNENITAQILLDYSNNICLKSYELLASESDILYTDVKNLVANTTQENLLKAQNQWKKTRQVWEKTEAHLFGPVATNNIDPRIDTWPVDFIRLDSVMSSSHVLTESYIDDLEESLKGFHPIEYLLFGLGGRKNANELTVRQKEYLEALTLNLRNLTHSLVNDWHAGFLTEFNTPGNTNYPTAVASYEEIVNAMIIICDEVANGKIDGVFVLQDSTLEESPFSNNSITDFTNNIIGVKESYLSQNGAKVGKGIEDLVKMHNLSLDGRIKQKMAMAIGALNNITVPFAKAIYTQPLQVQAAVDAINILKKELEDNLLPFIKQYAK